MISKWVWEDAHPTVSAMLDMEGLRDTSATRHQVAQVVAIATPIAELAKLASMTLRPRSAEVQYALAILAAHRLLLVHRTSVPRRATFSML